MISGDIYHCFGFGCAPGATVSVLLGVSDDHVLEWDPVLAGDEES